MLLSQNQKQIVEHEAGALLVTACPGSGKTRVLIERIKHLLLVTKRGKILAVTFTNKAADEMKNRLKDDSEVTDLVHRVTVGTLHSFALDIVMSRYHNIGLPSNMMVLDRDNDRIAILKEVWMDNPQLKHLLEEASDKQKILNNVLDRISLMKRRFIQPSDIDDDDDFATLYSEYNNRLLVENWLDYDDILVDAYRILTESQAVADLYRSSYNYLCVDEAQDLNYAQYHLIKAFCGDSFNNVMFVGDPKQSIFGFNGSSSTYMTEDFVNDFHPSRFELNENYRSAQSIVDFANQFGGEPSTLTYPIQGELLIESYSDEQSEARGVLERIRQLHKNGHPDVEGTITLNRIAVIARNRYVFKALEHELTQANISFYYQQLKTGLESESEIMKVFNLCLRFMANSKDKIHIHELLRIIKKQKPIGDEDSISLEQILTKTNYELLTTFFNDFDINNPNLHNMLIKIKENNWNITEEDKYMLLNDIENWDNHWSKYCFQVARENRTLSSFLNHAAIGKTRQDSHAQGISLLSAHMSKGTEFDVVFIIGLCEGIFPDYRAIATGNKAMEQERNNMYVAVTRAKRLCYLSYPKSRIMPWGGIKIQSPSRFIQDSI